jgi:predicted Zn finger-like uncharacterized protein
MSLATRCTSCGTVFRVVQDQLKVSEGWVRCGRCREVFNALEGLFDLEREAPPPWPPAGGAAAAATNTDSGQVHESAPTADAATASHPSTAAPSPAPTTAEQHAAAEPADDFEDARFHSELIDDSTAPLTVADAIGDSRLLEPEGPAPQFIRKAEKEERWRRPGVRVALALASLVLALLLAGQAMLHFRDALAARWPSTRQLIEPLCQRLDCRIEPLRHLESLAVDSSGLSAVDGAGLYRFTLVLHNRGTTAVLLPAIELSMTDAQGQLVSRKVLSAAELSSTERTVAAGAEVPLQALLAGGDRRIVGYQIDIFYP